MTSKYQIKLTEKERTMLINLFNRKKKVEQHTKDKAQILLSIDESIEREKVSDSWIAKKANCSESTIKLIRKQYHKEGIERVLYKKEHKKHIFKDGKNFNNETVKKIFDLFAKIFVTRTQLFNNSVSLRDIVKLLISNGVVRKISHETVRTMLNKYKNEIARRY